MEKAIAAILDNHSDCTNYERHASNMRSILDGVNTQSENRGKTNGAVQYPDTTKRRFSSSGGTKYHGMFLVKYVGASRVQDLYQYIEMLGNDELLVSGKVWFFQRKVSFMEQGLTPKWDPEQLDAYILFRWVC
jgi:hypothetical protein